MDPGDGPEILLNYLYHERRMGNYLEIFLSVHIAATINHMYYQDPAEKFYLSVKIVILLLCELFFTTKDIHWLIMLLSLALNQCGYAELEEVLKAA